MRNVSTISRLSVFTGNTATPPRKPKPPCGILGAPMRMTARFASGQSSCRTATDSPSLQSLAYPASYDILPDCTLSVTSTFSGSTACTWPEMSSDKIAPPPTNTPM